MKHYTHYGGIDLGTRGSINQTAAPGHSPSVVRRIHNGSSAEGLRVLIPGPKRIHWHLQIWYVYMVAIELIWAHLRVDFGHETQGPTCGIRSMYQVSNNNKPSLRSRILHQPTISLHVSDMLSIPAQALSLPELVHSISRFCRRSDLARLSRVCRRTFDVVVPVVWNEVYGAQHLLRLIKFSTLEFSDSTGKLEKIVCGSPFLGFMVFKC